MPRIHLRRRPHPFRPALSAVPRKNIEPRLREFKYLGGNRAQVTYEWIVNDTLDARLHLLRPCGSHRQAAAGPDHIVFQQDHGLPKPTSQWRTGQTIVDGPHELSVDDKCDAYDLSIGLFRGQRLRLQGLPDGRNRVLIAHLKLQRQGGQITSITAEPPVPVTGTTPEADFNVHLNPPGTFIDFAKVSTDGSLKIHKEKDRLVIFHYPREKGVRASLDLRQLLPGAKARGVQVRALGAGDQADLGLADFKLEGDRLLLTLGQQPGAGRYVVTLK